MSLVGKIDLSRLISASLDARALVQLCRDILFTKGHSQIRCTDGPGDGGRDIHSVIPKQIPHLTQSKFHSDPNLSCSSSELSELPMAMVKLGYNHGLFVTNGKISPQGKREFLDNYPNLTLEFLDGENLAAEILADTLLRAIWFDGASISRVNMCTVYPILVRSHEGDKPVLLDERDATPALSYLRGKRSQLSFLFRRATSTSEPFG